MLELRKVARLHRVKTSMKKFRKVSKSIGNVTTCLSQALLMVLIFVVDQNTLLPVFS